MLIKKCPNCKTEMLYDGINHCFECSGCDKTYNAVLQELKPRKEWQAEYDSEDY